MKVDFSTTKLHSAPINKSVNKSQQSSLALQNSTPLKSIVKISFKGNLNKNFSQFASIAAEDKGLGIPEYNRGGLAAVAQEAPESWAKYQGADIRSFSPYHCYDNPEGKIKVLKIQYDPQTGQRINAVDPALFHTEPLDYQLKEGESFVIQSAPSKGKSKFVELRPTGVNGSVKRLATSELKQTEIPYTLFKVVNLPGQTGVTRYIMHTADLAKLTQSYGSGSEGAYGAYGAYGGAKPAEAVQTAQDTAKTVEATAPQGIRTETTVAKGGSYGAYGAYGGDGCTNLAYSDNDKAVIDALPKLASKEHGEFKPANIWAHDRTAFPVISEIADRSAKGEDYYQGLRIGGTYHNPGRAYQGVYSNPLDFLRLVASPEDIQELQKHPDFEFLKKADSLMRSGQATAEDMAKVDKIIKPFIAPFLDDFGTYNMTMIPIRGTQANPFNIISGTVSCHYGQEMKNHNTFSIAEGLTGKFASTVTANITNGSTPANLKLDKPEADFGRGNNGLSDAKAGFKTFKPVIENGTVSNIDEILAAKKSNTKWLLDLIGKADTKVDPEALQKLFFEDESIHVAEGKRPSTVLGQLSSYQEGDKLFMGWGRPDPQKGFPTTFEGFLKFLKDPTVSEDVKKHTKLLVGAGSDTWTEDARDWKNIQKLLKEIQELEGGKYKGNAMYVNGLFPNRLVGCAYNSAFTSVFEPCGITPFESFVAGTPPLSIRTGGAPDFIASYDMKGAVTTENGFLTSGPYLRNPENIGLTKEKLATVKAEDMFGVIDDQRRAISSDDIAQCFKKAATLDDANYRQMSINSILQKVDWHENAAYNGGKSANVRYMREFWHLDEKTMTELPGLERNTKPLNRLVGKFGQLVDTTIDAGKKGAQQVVKKAKFGGKKLIGAISVGVVAIGGIAYYIKNHKAIDNTQIASTPINQEEPKAAASTTLALPFQKPKAFAKIG